MNCGANDPACLQLLSWSETAEWFRRDPPLLLPVGGCIQHGPHLPLGTDTVIVEHLARETVRIRSIDTHALDLSRYLAQGNAPERAGELETSLLLHLAPELVREEWILDSPAGARGTGKVGASAPMPGSPGVVGLPSLASAEKGRVIYEHMVDTISARLTE